MKYLIIGCVLLTGCTSLAEQRARAISADDTQCQSLHGIDTESTEYLECMQNLAAERQKKRRIEEARRAAQDAGRMAIPAMQNYRTF
jgi:outer membrane biogenesis lipoprotein LolB